MSFLFQKEINSLVMSEGLLPYLYCKYSFNVEINMESFTLLRLIFDLHPCRMTPPLNYKIEGYRVIKKSVDFMAESPIYNIITTICFTNLKKRLTTSISGKYFLLFNYNITY